jgi:hypothetical protein
MESDYFGLFVKDLSMWNVITMCNSSEPLYIMYLPSHPTPSSHVAAPLTLVASASTWHRHLDHPGVDVLSKLSHDSSVICSWRTHNLCHACKLGHHTHLPIVSYNSHADNNFDLIHYDMWTSPIVSISGYKYYIVILDDHSHFVWTFPLSVKSHTFSTLSNFFAYVSTQFGRTIKVIQCNNDHDFDNAPSHTFFATNGVILRMSYPYTSQQNGKAERILLTINNILCSLLFQACIPTHYWVEGLHTTTYLLNHLPTKAISTISPYFALHGVVPSYEHLCVFSCACYPNLSAKATQKLAPWSTRCVFLEYFVDHKGYRCLNLTTNNIVVS